MSVQLDQLTVDKVAPEADAPRSTVRKRHRTVRIVAPMVVFVAVIGIWLFVSYVLLDSSRRFLMPPPQSVVQVGFFETANLTEILHALWSTTQVAIVGLAISMAIGTLVAVAMSQAIWVESAIYPWAVVLQTIPILAIVPLIGFWFQYGFNSRVLICVLISLFPIITNTLFGLKSVDRSHHDLFTLQRASRWKRFFKLQLPSALPATVTGWRIAAGLSVVGAIVGDFFFRQGEPGIGRLIDDYLSGLQTQQLFGAIILSSLLGLTVFWIFGFLGRVLVGSWHDSQQTRELE
ncbi:MAG TPA: ABC transporter permease [Acidimicrobiales bacterium]|nr:ABC transporter permease [Acidimicrobiales bacterium]